MWLLAHATALRQTEQESYVFERLTLLRDFTMFVQWDLGICYRSGTAVYLSFCLLCPGNDRRSHTVLALPLCMAQSCSLGCWSQSPSVSARTDPAPSNHNYWVDIWGPQAKFQKWPSWTFQKINCSPCFIKAKKEKGREWEWEAKRSFVVLLCRFTPSQANN